MNTQKALQVYEAFIEQAMAAGMFKQLQQLDIARQSLAVLKSAVENQNKHDNGNSETVQP